MGNDTSGEKAYSFKLTPENKLGEDPYSEVYKIERKFDKKLCVAKFFELSEELLKPSYKLEHERELYILQKLSNPFLV